MNQDRDARWRSRTHILIVALTVLGAGAVGLSCKGRDGADKASRVAKAEPEALQVGGLPVT